MSNLPPPLPPAGPPIAPPVIPVEKPRMGLVSKIIIGVVVIFFAFLGFRLVQFASYLRAHPRARAPGEAEFREANRVIIASHGTIGFGNTPEAIALAETYSRELKSLREAFFSKGKGDDDLFTSLTKSDFPTYCLLTTNTCVFLVHVPELRRFSTEARESLGQLAWVTAQQTVLSNVPAPPTRLVVGVKGELSYDPILIGKVVSGGQAIGEGVERRGSGILDMQLFYPFFATQPGRSE